MEMSAYLSDTFLSDIYPYFESKLRNTTSRQNYRIALNHICDFCKKDFISLTEADVRKYMTALADGSLKNARGKAFTKTSLSVRMSCLRSIANALDGTEGLFPLPPDYVSPFRRIEICDTPDIEAGRIPSVEDIDLILRHADEQMKILVYLAYRCCLTVSELMELTPAHFAVDRKNHLFMHFSPLVAPERDVKIPDDIRPEVERYLLRIGPGAIRLFVNKRGGAFCEKTLYCAFRRLVVSARTTSVWTLQDIRNAGICHIRYSGAAPEDVAAFLGVLPKWIRRYDKAIGGMDLQPNDLSVVQVKELGTF